MLRVFRFGSSSSASLCRAYGNGGRGGVVASFKDVCFGYGVREILEDTSFSVRGGSKVTIMGQNGAGKSSIIKLLSGEMRAGSGTVNILPGETVAVAKQTMPVACREMTVTQYFASHFDGSVAGNASAAAEHPGPRLDARIAAVLEQVELVAPAERLVRSFSGGQQARLLLAGALISDPSILLLDEPTNNLDAAGIAHLRELLAHTDKTVLVISHDEGFLNSFTDSVLYLDVFAKAVEQHAGDYFFVKAEVERRIARENAANARLAAAAKKKVAQAGKFAGKGGGMRLVAKRMRSVAADMEGQLVDVRREDTVLRDFAFPFSLPPAFTGNLLTLSQLSSRCPQTGSMVAARLKDGPLKLGRKDRLRVLGPNGIGKTTFLELVAKGTAPGLALGEGARVGYYRQDFHNFDFDASVLATLAAASDGAHTQQQLRNTAASFMLSGDTALQPVATLSEGQKALLSLACLVLEAPSVLIMDEPTNHVNFRHLPAVAAAVRSFEGAVLLVSHDAGFCREVGAAKELDMGYELQAEAQDGEEQRVEEQGGRDGGRAATKKGGKEKWSWAEMGERLGGGGAAAEPGEPPAKTILTPSQKRAQKRALKAEKKAAAGRGQPQGQGAVGKAQKRGKPAPAPEVPDAPAYRKTRW